MDIRVEDHECVRPDGSVMAIRVARPVGDGPFPAVVDVHGGGWVMGDRRMNALIDDALAAHGIIAAAPEFRMPPEGRYPTSIVDVHLAIRWLKANATTLGGRPELVGGLGTSSGAHQLLECALRPGDPRYDALLLSQAPDADARVGYVVACWPVADPLRRFHYAQERGIKNLLDAHAAYWPNEAAMAEGSPQLVLERKFNGPLMPLMMIQGTNDDNLPPDMAARFAAAWRNAGGSVVLHEFAGMPHAFITRQPDAAASKEALSLIVAFIKAQSKRPT
jgi:acetyl esterase